MVTIIRNSSKSIIIFKNSVSNEKNKNKNIEMFSWLNKKLWQ